MRFRGLATATLSFGLIMGSVAAADAAPFVVGWGGEKIVTVSELPDTNAFRSGHTHFDLGYRFKQVTFFFIPVWNYDGHWCGAIRADSSHFFDFNRERLERIAESAGITLPTEPSLSAWDSYGGKALAGALLLGYGLFRLQQRRAGKQGAAVAAHGSASPSGAPVS